MGTRNRSSFESQEKLATEYIKSCVDFRTNITFTDIATVNDSTVLAPNILLIGTDSELHAEGVHALPFYSPVIAEALSRVGENKKSSICVLTQLPNSKAGGKDKYVSVHIACIPHKASRNNCPFRPDVITEVVKSVCEHLHSSHDEDKRDK
uniref:Elongin-C n=1 Tax=Lygus hesperus TaxID=30085 RepID=A0A0A9X883_LYGHE